MVSLHAEMNKRDTNPSTKFTDEEIEDLREAFNLFVKGKPGKIAASDIGALFKTVGQSCTDEELHAIITRASEEKNLLNFHQFLKIMEDRRPTYDRESEIREAFRHFDKGGNGRISMRELRRMMVKLGERLTDEELDEMMREADLNGDGQIDFKDARGMDNFILSDDLKASHEYAAVMEGTPASLPDKWPYEPALKGYIHDAQQWVTIPGKERPFHSHSD